MQILSVDVGMGTQDIFLYDSEKSIENCFKIVAPSQTQIVAKKIKMATESRRDIFFTGTTMGGGPCCKAAKDHLKKGLKIYATELAAKTFDDDLNLLKNLGFEIANEAPSKDIVEIDTIDIDILAIKNSIENFNVEFNPDGVAIAVQDHGEAPPEISDRVFRFEYIKSVLEKGGDLFSFSYRKEDIPPHLTRMKSVARTLSNPPLSPLDKGGIEGISPFTKSNSLSPPFTKGNLSIPPLLKGGKGGLPSKNILVMDTGFAALAGILSDPIVKTKDKVITVNVGNGHTLVAYLVKEEVVGLFEHHTSKMNSSKLDDYIIKLTEGKLTFEHIFEDGGHGCFVNKNYDFSGFDEVKLVSVTGPNRKIMIDSSLNPYFAAPYGDMMLTGCFGLIEAYKRKT
ncbi:MAG: DUF1786 domain-containing protein [Actinobacteria bacterium]|nr:DUF1786 domain-containing protein [Actinomycetota bacterium]